ncbi:MAG: SMI1/KNR4 family protein [Proteobacteria bacterium]|nr:SMI1/KNR4 family protein [Pseudomonadota bacterium]
MSFDQLKERAKVSFGKYPLTDKEIQNVEKILGLKLPQDFIEINKVCSYEYSNVFSFLNFSGTGVTEGTLGLWSYFQCPHEFIILYDDGSGVILMDTKNSSSVTYASIEDTENIVFRKKLNYQHSFFSTFADFYVYLLDEEEKKRAEEKSL